MPSCFRVCAHVEPVNGDPGWGCLRWGSVPGFGAVLPHAFLGGFLPFRGGGLGVGIVAAPNLRFAHLRRCLGVLQALHFQGEISSSGRFHWQGYLEFRTRRTLLGVKAQLDEDRIYLDRRRASTREPAIDYVHKEDTRVLPGLALDAPDVAAKSQKKKSSSAGEVAVALRTRSTEEVCDEAPGVALLHYEKVQAYRSRVLYKEKWREQLKKTCVVVTGPSGSGKTTSVYQAVPEGASLMRSYMTGPPQQRVLWFPAEFDSEEYDHVLIDDYNGEDIPITDLLQILDERLITVNVKHGSRAFFPTHIWITSNVDLDDWYPEASEEHKYALKRRVQHIRVQGRRREAAIRPTITVGMDSLSSQLASYTQQQGENVSPRVEEVEE